MGGPAAFVCLIALITSSGISRRIGKFVNARSKRIQEARDKRSKLMTEMLTGIKTVKLQVWEPIWHARITKAREEEMRELVHVQILQALNVLAGNILSMLVPVSIFSWYILVEGRPLDATTAFTTMAWIQSLRWSVQSLPSVFNLIADLRPTVERVDEFLTRSVSIGIGGNNTGQMPAGSVGEWRDESWLSAGNNRSTSQSFFSNDAIVVEDASFGYQSKTDSGDVTEVVLDQINLSIPWGSLVMIAGPVGSGKSTLLASLSGARPALNGLCETSGRRAYASQKPFLLNASIQENILFGLPFDQCRYQEAIVLAALPEDIKALPKGSDTLVGENGVQLSGGQKARVALARVVYADADTVLLDDVLSAVDAHTGKYLWDNCIVGWLKKRQKNCDSGQSPNTIPFPP